MSGLNLNLLPWRQRQMARRRRVYLAVLVSCALLPGLALVLSGLDARAQVNEKRAQASAYAKANQAAAELDEEAALLAREIEHLHAWLAEIDHLEQHRGVFVSLWADLAAQLPDSMHFSALILDGLSLQIQGFTTSSPDLASYLRRLESSSALEAPRLIDLEDEPGGKRFGVQATVRIPASGR